MIPDMPLFGLRMKPSPLAASSLDVDCNEALDSLGVMTAQDAHYRCSDYFARYRSGVAKIHTLHGESHADPELAVDQVCREKMCEWSYRVCDHFRTTREVVAFAFSFLDRFIDRYNCDRTTFKLASMTAFFMATKMLNVKQISLCSLAELSRGEFDPDHIADMEKFILTKLQWRMNPPTVQAFISYLRIVLPPADSAAQDEIYQRSIFFAEISVYDYTFATEERYLLAVACILNAVEGIDDIKYAKELRQSYLRTLSCNLCVELDLAALDRAQKRLWYLYSCSAQIQYEDMITHSLSKERMHPTTNNFEKSNHSHSPIGVTFNG
jgi:Cyclin, N-terminal domain